MTDQANAKQILAYVDQLNSQTAALTGCIEQHMKQKGYVSLPSVGDKVNWYLSPSYKQPDGWRLRDVGRFFVRDNASVTGGAALYDTSVFYQILLDAESPFPFLPVLCGRVRHASALSEHEINTRVYWTHRLKSLCSDQPEWTNLKEEDGWYLATPAYRSPIATLRGYILNLYDLTSEDIAAQNIVAPLTAPEPPGPLSGYLTIPAYAFPALAKAGDPTVEEAEVKLEAARSSLAALYGVVEPVTRPEDFERASEMAQDDQAMNANEEDE